MLRINIFNKNKINRFIKKNYATNIHKKEIIPTDIDEIEKFFSSVDKDEWLIIEFLGDIKELENSLSLLSINVMLKYFIDITLPEDYTFDEALKIPKIIEKRNIYENAKIILCMSVDVRLRPGELAIRFIIPRYAYKDIWS